MEPTTTIATIITDVGSLVTGAVSWIGSFVGAITSSPLLMIFAILSLVGLGVGLLKRLFSVN